MNFDTFFANLKTEAAKVWGEGTAFASAEWTILFNAFKTVWLALQPGEVSSLWPLIAEAVADVEDGDLNDIETAVLDKAEANGLTFVENLAEGVLPALISIFKASPATPSTTATATTAA